MDHKEHRFVVMLYKTETFNYFAAFHLRSTIPTLPWRMIIITWRVFWRCLSWTSIIVLFHEPWACYPWAMSLHTMNWVMLLLHCILDLPLPRLPFIMFTMPSHCLHCNASFLVAYPRKKLFSVPLCRSVISPSPLELAPVHWSDVQPSIFLIFFFQVTTFRMLLGLSALVLYLIDGPCFYRTELSCQD